MKRAYENPFYALLSSWFRIIKNFLNLVKALLKNQAL